RVPGGLPERHGRLGRGGPELAQPGAGEEGGDDGSGDEERHRVDDEGNAQTEAAEQSPDERADDSTEEEGAGEHRGDPPPDRWWRQPDDERGGGHREHGRSDAAEGAVEEELDVAVGEGRGAGREGHDEEAGEVDRPLAQPGHEAPAEWREDEPEERERAD